MANKLFLLDGMALVYRAHFALIRSPIFTSGGVNSSALFVFTNTLVDLIGKHAPTHIAVAFDTSAPTSRHEIFPEYKAQRQEMPEDLAAAIPHVKRLVEAFRIPVIEKDGFEADDIIGTLAKRADEAGGFTTYMVTPDKDFAQLVSDKTLIYKPGTKGGEHVVIDLPKVLEQWEIGRVDQVTDILGLAGDASDNIPGIPGVGDKTAKKLIGQFGSVEGVLENVDQLKGKQKEKVEAFGEQAVLSKKLATIIRDVPLDIGFDDLVIGEPDRPALEQIFVEFEFNALGKRFFGDEFKAGRGKGAKGAGSDGEQGMLFDELKTLNDVPHDYRAARTVAEAEALVETLDRLSSFCFDLETSSLDLKTCEIVGVAFSWKAHEGVYADCTVQGVLDVLRPVLEKEGVEKVGHNLKFDLGCLLWNGIRAGGVFFDTMLVHSLVEPDKRHGMDMLSEMYLGYTPISIESLIGSKKDKDGQLSMLELTGEKFGKIAEYAAEDADVTWQLAEVLRPKLKESGQEKVYSEIEAPLLPVLVGLEHAGIALDTGALKEISESLTERIATLEAQIQKAAGTKFNVNSPKQLGQVLFDILKLVDKPKKTKTGQYKTDEQTLAALAPEHDIVRDILDYRESAKLKSTYVDALPAVVCKKTGRVHTTFHQLMAATGRLASSNPNIQNIPVRTEQGKEIRKAFVAGKKGSRLLSADYSQIELRVMASISGDGAMIEAFEKGLDIHTATAAKVYGVGLDGVLSEMRRTAKMVNFGIIYGISAFGLSQRLGIPRAEATKIIESYFEKYPGVKSFMEDVVAKAQKDGYVETLVGRRRYLRDITSSNANIRATAERVAINTPIQGTAADMIKVAMAKIVEALREGGYTTTMLLQVHDELVFELAEGEEVAVKTIVGTCMREALPLRVPVVVEMGTGQNWLEAH